MAGDRSTSGWWTVTSAGSGPGVTLVPVGGGRTHAATVLRWRAGGHEEPVPVLLSCPRRSAEALDGRTVWLSVPHSSGSGLVVWTADVDRPGAEPHSGAAGPGPGVDHLVVRNHLALVTEHRRTTVRATFAGPARLRQADGRRQRTRLIDLSTGGCSLRLPDAAALHTDEPVAVDLELLPGRPLTLTARVARLDREAGVAGLRFTDLPPEIAGLLERAVLGQMGGRTDGPTGGPTDGPVSPPG